MDLQTLKKIAENEDESREYFKTLREKNGIQCSRCKSKNHYWFQSSWQWKCKNCSKPITLKSQTILMHSNLPISTWFKAILILSTSKANISASEMQRRLNLKRYESVWFMMHKLRLAMGQTLVRMINFNLFEVQADQCANVSLIRKIPKLKNQQKVTIASALRNFQNENPMTMDRPILIHSQKNYMWENELNLSEKSMARRRYFLKRLNRHSRYSLPKIDLEDSQKEVALTRILENFQSKISTIHLGVAIRYLQKYLDEFSFHGIFDTVRKFEIGITFSLLNESWGIPSS
jgi:hypothetical protein